MGRILTQRRSACGDHDTGSDYGTVEIDVYVYVAYIQAVYLQDSMYWAVKRVLWGIVSTRESASEGVQDV